MHLSLVDLERLADVLVEVLDVLVRERPASGGPGVEDAEVVHVDGDDEFRVVAGEGEAARVRLGLHEPPGNALLMDLTLFHQALPADGAP